MDRLNQLTQELLIFVKVDDQLAYEQRNLLEIINKLEAGLVQVSTVGGCSSSGKNSWRPV